MHYPKNIGSDKINENKTTHHFVSSANENSDGTGTGTPFNHEHAISGGTEWDFLDAPGSAEFGLVQFFESRNDPTAGGDSY